MLSRAELELDCKPSLLQTGARHYATHLCSSVTVARVLLKRGAVQRPVIRIFSMSASQALDETDDARLPAQHAGTGNHQT
jgi:hypothetical protein